MFYLIGLGLNLKSLSVEALEVLKKCKRVYLENYTVDFPYSLNQIEKEYRLKISALDREAVEDEKFLDEAKKENIALLVYGSPLAATTHISLILKCKKDKIDYKVLHNASILDAISETGLQIYKFGKITSMPSWKENYKPNSFCKIIKENQKIKAHTLLLVDIGLSRKDALEQFEEACKDEEIKPEKIVICSKLGTEDSKIYYNFINNF